MKAERLEQLWRRHGRTFWILHSVWALGTGIAVLSLAKGRYDFVYWVVGFLGLTWVSTLFFSRRPFSDGRDGFAARFRRGLASYLTRVLYQETLFFILPFYAYSVVFPSWNVTFVAFLVLLAILACLDLLFDRWLRENPAFSLIFFASVSFGALNLLLPMLFSISPSSATPVAAMAAVGTAAPLVLRGGVRGVASWLRLWAAGAAIVAVAVWFRPLVPPAPLRVQEIEFAADLDRSTLEPTWLVASDTPGGEVGGQLIVLVRVFAPTSVPARVALDWYLDDALVRSSREVQIVAHEGGFRFWDALRPDSGTLAPGDYRVVMRTADHRLFGKASIRLR
jgi:hypothetical protein